jgi:hypothetical protein
MVKYKTNKPDCKVPIPFMPEKDKDEDPKEKSVAVKLTINLAGEALPNPPKRVSFNFTSKHC